MIRNWVQSMATIVLLYGCYSKFATTITTTTTTTTTTISPAAATTTVDPHTIGVAFGLIEPAQRSVRRRHERTVISRQTNDNCCF